jgi:tripartite-type tricarboxylate transporter receptor subunit TctC
MLPVRCAISFVATALAFAFVSATAWSQAYPEKPITFIIPFGAGGGADVIARTVQEDIRKELGQPVIIENRPGANGAIGSAVAARAKPDGYTLLLTATSTFSLNPNIMKDIQYDQIRDFIPVGFFVRAPWMLVVNAKSQFKSVADLVKAAKGNPDKITFGYWQSSVLVSGEMLQRAAGVQFLKIPYRGVTEALADLMGERIDVLYRHPGGSRLH